MSKPDLLVEKHVIDDKHELFGLLDTAAFLSKNLYNLLNYRICQEYFERERMGSKAKLLNLDLSVLYAYAKDTSDYKAMNSKVANEVVKQIVKNWFDYFASMKAYSIDPSGFLGKPKPPKYKNKAHGRNLVHFDIQAISKNKKYTKNSLICLTSLGVVFRSNVPRRDVRHVKIVVINDTCYQLHVVYFNNRKQENQLDDSLYMGCDLGLDNLCTLTSNKLGFIPVIVSGSKIKSINQFYNKRKADMQSKLPDDQSVSKPILRLGNKRRQRIEFHFHQTTNYIIQLCLENNIANLVVGKNDGWKQEIALGKRTNQSFVSIPYDKLLRYLKYKCFNAGINLVITEESYTSKSSLLDLDPLPRYGETNIPEFSGYRESRGMYKRKGVSGKYSRINADVNGSYNIIRKVNPNLFTREGVAALAVVPRKVTF